MQVTALKSFEHNGPVRRGAIIEVSEIHAKELKRAGLVEYEESFSNPLESPLASPVSALPAAPASPQTIVEESGSGDIPKPRRPLAKRKAKPARKKKL
jgi:hypothetical protein